MSAGTPFVSLQALLCTLVEWHARDLLLAEAVKGTRSSEQGKFPKKYC